MELLGQIKTLVFELRGSYQFELSETTCLQKDLGIYGDDALEFIEYFAERFQVDISAFAYRDYFTGEGGIVTPWLIPNHDFGKKSLTLGDLEVAARVGRLQ